MTYLRLLGVVMLLLAASPHDLSAENDAPDRIVMATTTSTANTGLLDELLPVFEKKTGMRVDFVAVGSGAALKLAENGDVDVVLVHAPEAEEQFVREGHGLARVPLMYNDFVILGPPTDPASIGTTASAAEAFARIADRAEVPLISRGDESGTHMREKLIWESAGLTPSGDWYLDAGQGMAGCLIMAHEKRAYVLSDRGTYLAKRANLDIAILFEGDSLLVNQYSVIAVNQKRRPGGNHEGALALIDWLTSEEGQAEIDAFRVDGERLFHPNAEETAQR